MDIKSVSGLKHIDEKIDEYKNEQIRSQLKQLKQLCPKYRGIRGDGNCYYRSIIFYYLEFILIHNRDGTLMRALIDEVNHMKFEQVCTQESLQNERMNNFDKEEYIVLLRDLYNLSKQNLDISGVLEKLFNNCKNFDFCSIIFVRGLILKNLGTYLQQDRYGGFLLENDQIEIQILLETYGREAEGLIIPFAAETFRVQLVYYSLANGTHEFYQHLYPETQEYEILFNIPLFFRPGHYDLCYSEQWPACPNQITTLPNDEEEKSCQNDTLEISKYLKDKNFGQNEKQENEEGMGLQFISYAAFGLLLFIYFCKNLL